MQISGKIHCFFEQSGTFRDEFRALGFTAEDYDIQNDFGQTDHVIDLFAEIDSAWEGKPSLFDSISKDDLVMAFFPCIYFCDASSFKFSFAEHNYRALSDEEKLKKILERSELRQRFYTLVLRLYGLALRKGFKMVLENPWSGNHYFKNNNFPKPPSIVDCDRTLRGDYFKKPTAYWFVNFEPTEGRITEQQDKERKTIYGTKSSGQAGICSEERSMISRDYARNFIHDFILGDGKRKSSILDFAV